VRIARIVTDVLSPGYVVIGLLLVIGWNATGTVEGLGWGLLAAVICGACPLGLVFFGVWRGWWTDVHVSVRKQRFVPVTAAAVANLAGVGILLALHAPRALVALVLAVLAGLVAGGIITIWWKISGHTAVAGAAATALTVAYGPVLLAAFLVVAVIGWSRVTLRDHTPAQATAGLLLGVLAVGAIFVPLR
jgi:membrane-associated phospholipid phosphatase